MIEYLELVKHPMSALKLFASQNYVKRNLEPYIAQKTTEFTGLEIDHETSLVKILSLLKTTYDMLPDSIREEKNEIFSDYLHFIAHSTFLSDIINLAIEAVPLEPNWDGLDGIIQRIPQDTSNLEGIKEQNLYKIADGHRTEALNLLQKIEDQTSVKIEDDYLAIISTALEYERKEKEFADDLKSKNYKKVLRQIDDWSSDLIQKNLTYARVGFIFEFTVELFYKLFVDNDSRTDFSEKYPIEEVTNWAKYTALALQIGGDDVNDLGVFPAQLLKGSIPGNDIMQHKPTPLILKILNSSINEMMRFNETAVNYGINRTEAQVNNYFDIALSNSIPDELTVTTNFYRKKIKKNFARLKKHEDKIVELLTGSDLSYTGLVRTYY